MQVPKLGPVQPLCFDSCLTISAPILSSFTLFSKSPPVANPPLVCTQKSGQVAPLFIEPGSASFWPRMLQSRHVNAGQRSNGDSVGHGRLHQTLSCGKSAHSKQAARSPPADRALLSTRTFESLSRSSRAARKESDPLPGRSQAGALPQGPALLDLPSCPVKKPQQQLESAVAAQQIASIRRPLSSECVWLRSACRPTGLILACPLHRLGSLSQDASQSSQHFDQKPSRQ